MKYPTTNTGTENPSVATAIRVLSSSPPARQAANTPAATAKVAANTIVTRLSEMVAGSRSMTNCITGAPEKIEVPNWPRRMFQDQMPNCTGSGLSRPS